MISQLQSKYKELKKSARQMLSNMKRNIARTGNKDLEPSTVNAMNNQSLLLRKNMGATQSQSRKVV